MQPLITPVITPRFVPSCTPTLMRGLASIADEHQLPLQSHLSENLAECEWVRSLHPDCESYSDVYDKHGLYTPRSYMAHCVHCARAERDLVLRKGVGIVHCPNSNFTLASGVCNVREWLEEGHKVGLGTDVAGGYSPCILNAIRMARVASVATTAPVGGGETSAAVGAGGGAGGEAQHHVTLSYNGKGSRSLCVFLRSLKDAAAQRSSTWQLWVELHVWAWYSHVAFGEQENHLIL